MVRTKMVGAAIAAAAVLGATVATPAQAATHPCDAAFEDPTLAAVCGFVMRTACSVIPPPVTNLC